MVVCRLARAVSRRQVVPVAVDVNGDDPLLTDHGTGDTLAAVAHTKPWSDPELYDLGFSFDTAEESAFFSQLFRRHRQAKLDSLLDLACGAGRFLLVFGKAGLHCVGVDNSPVMLDYCRRRLDDEDLEIDLLCADLAGYTLEQPCDVALCGRDSINYLIEDWALERHLEATAAALTSGGLYVIDTSLFPPGQYQGQRTWSWTEPTPQGRVRARYRIARPPTAADRVYVETLDIRLEPPDGAPERRYVQRSNKRAFAAGELEAVVQASGCFEIAGRYADLSLKATFERQAFPDRLILVLRKRG